MLSEHECKYELIERGDGAVGYKCNCGNFMGCRTDKVLAILNDHDPLTEKVERLELKAKHVARSVETIRLTMQKNHNHKDLFGGVVYLVDHTHMWALVRNTEELDALLESE